MEPTNEKMLINGYQYSPDFVYRGAYQFPNNEDKHEIHLPPNTTLVAPPVTIPAGQEAVFDLSKDVWYLRDVDLSWMDMDGRIKYLAHLAEIAAAEQQPVAVQSQQVTTP